MIKQHGVNMLIAATLGLNKPWDGESPEIDKARLFLESLIDMTASWEEASAKATPLQLNNLATVWTAAFHLYIEKVEPSDFQISDALDENYDLCRIFKNSQPLPVTGFNHPAGGWTKDIYLDRSPYLQQFIFGTKGEQLEQIKNNSVTLAKRTHLVLSRFLDDPETPVEIKTLILKSAAADAANDYYDLSRPNPKSYTRWLRVCGLKKFGNKNPSKFDAKDMDWAKNYIRQLPPMSALPVVIDVAVMVEKWQAPKDGIDNAYTLCEEWLPSLSTQWALLRSLDVPPTQAMHFLQVTLDALDADKVPNVQACGLPEDMEIAIDSASDIAAQL